MSTRGPKISDPGWRRATKYVRGQTRKFARLYQVWFQMKGRCFNARHPKYHRYGGRGISLCAEWMDYGQFRAWAVSNGYRKGLSIERRNNDGDYEPSNCTWIPVSLQQDNTERVHMLTVDGKTKPIPFWSRKTGIKASIINSRVRQLGWSHKDAVTVPVGSSRF